MLDQDPGHVLHLEKVDQTGQIKPRAAMHTLDPPNAVPYWSFPDNTPACRRAYQHIVFHERDLHVTFPANNSIILPTVIREGKP